VNPSAKDVEQSLKPSELIFGLAIQNIPTINLRDQYAHDRKAVFADGLSDWLRVWKRGREDVFARVTHPDPDVYFTTLIRSTISGIECTLPNSAIQELVFHNRLTRPLLQAIRDTPKRAMADAYYNKIPEYVNPQAPLKTCDKSLWKDVCRFYAEIRNPLSHGYQLRDVKADSLQAVFGMFDKVYAWIDSWSDRYRLQRILKSTTFMITPQSKVHD